LQSLNPIFKPEVNDDIDAVTLHLQRRGLVTTRLVRTRDGSLCKVMDGQCWRVLTFVPDTHTLSRVQDQRVAAEAGALVGRFHLALSDLQHTFKFARLGVHDTPRHMQTLSTAFAQHGSHRYFARIAPVAEKILREWDLYGAAASPPTKQRLVHGDLKISNVLFNAQGAVCLIDLDTLANMPLMHELGDAWRSWCNPVGEDSTQTRFDMSLFRASASAYFKVARAFITPEELASLEHGTALIALELSARFCADAFRESYFGWNAEKYPDRSTHNLERAMGQLNLYSSVRAQQGDIARVLREGS
jgi:Ser/Thr protein kinase RdoA (MazF antagonist)